MTDFLRFLFAGLGIGAIYGIAAIGVVLIYKGAKVVNFAQGAMAMVGAFLYYEGVQAGLGTAPAIAVALAGTALIGTLLQLLVMRRLERASSATRVVATVALLAALQAVAAIRYEGITRFLPPLLPAGRISLAGVPVNVDRLCLLGVGVLLTLGLTVLYRRTRFGLATTAAAENPLAAAALGYRPRNLALANWTIGAGLAGLAGVLVGPIVGLDPTQLSQIVFPALAAALVGGFSRFGLVFLAAIALGIVESESTGYISAPGWSTAIPFVVVLIVLAINSAKSRFRAEPVEDHPPVGSGTTSVPMILFGVGTVVLAVCTLPVGWLSAITVTLVFSVLALSLVVLTGYSGQLSFAQFTFAGIGAATAAHLSADLSMPFIVALLAGTLAAGLFGLIFALPTLRTRGISIAIVTLGLAISVEAVLFNNASFNGGVRGLPIKSPTLFGLDVSAVDSPLRYALVVLAFLVIAAFAVAHLRRSRTGRALIALRGRSEAAASLGINVVAGRLYAFALSAAIAGLGGVLLAFTAPNVFLSQYGFFNSATLLVTVVLAGVGLVGGGMGAGMAITGGVTWYALAFTGQQAYLPLALGVLTLVQLAAVPGGFVFINIRGLERFRAKHGLKSHVRHPLCKAAPGPVTPHTDHVLDVEHVCVRFGGVQALKDVSLSVRAGEVHGLIGANGAGKTTLIDAITGVTRGYTGTVRLDGQSLDRRTPWDRARAGVARSFQGLELIEDLTVGENLAVAGERLAATGYVTDLAHPTPGTLSSAAQTTIEALDLDATLDRFPGELPYGRRRLVAVARAMAGAPAILLLDEPAAGLDPVERREFGALIANTAKNAHVGVLLVEHDVGMVLEVSDRVTVLVEGEVLATGTPAEIRADERVVATFLGTHAQEQDTPAQQGSRP